MEELTKLLLTQPPTNNNNQLLNIHKTLSTTTITTPDDDHHILEQLRQHAKLAQSNFDAIDTQLADSSQKVQKLIKEAQAETQRLKPISERVHEEFMKYEDEYIDHHESLKPNPAENLHSVQEHTGNARLIDSISEQIHWLKELRRLRLWFSLLLDFRNRSAELLSSAGQPSSTNELESSADQLFELIQSYQDLRKRSHSSNHFNLYQYIHQIIRQSLHSLIEIISEHVAQTLENEIEWPQPSRAPLDFKSPSTARILSSFKTAVKFQNKLNSKPNLVSLAERRPEQADQESVIWLPLLEGSILLKAILKPITLRFRFHFDGHRPTNRLDKPEWYFNHILDRLAEHEKLIKSDLQKLFELSGQGFIKVFHGFTVHLIKVVEKKLKRSVPGILEMKPILAHTIEKAIAFDHVIQQMNYLSVKSDDRSSQWLGTVDGILSNHQWFKIWFEAEKRFVDDMYLEIISSKDTWEVNEEDQRPMSMNIPATNSALKMQDLVEQIKSKYEGLPRLSYQAEFLIKIQMVVLEAYSQRISGVLDGFERNRLMTVVGGGESSRSKMNMGLKGLERLAKVYLSCNWMVACFRSWNDDLFYAELYDELKREKMPATAEVEKLLNSIEAVDGLDRTLFSGLVARFEELSRRAEAAIVRQVVQEIMVELKPYFAKRWDLEVTEGVEGGAGGGGGCGEVDELSVEIVPAISVWKSRIKYLRETIRPTIKMNKLMKPITKEIECKLLDKMIFEPFSIRSITLAGGRQLEFDVMFGWLNSFSTCYPQAHQSAEGDGKPAACFISSKYFSRLLDCCKLLSYPPPPSSSSHPPFPPFEELVSISFAESDDGDVRFTQLVKDRLRVSSLTKRECQLVLKRRPECWKT